MKRKKRQRAFREFCGKVQLTRDGSAYIIVDGDEEDIFVKTSRTRHALNGDRVIVAMTREKSGGKHREGEVVKILERSRVPFVGIFHTVGAQAWVLMQSKTMPYDIEVDLEEALSMGAERGMKVAARVERWDRGDRSPIGHVVDVLGEPGRNETEMHAILAEFNLPYRFEKEVENAADSISEKIGPEELKGRKDFRRDFTFTIDPADAKDFDDALSFKRLENGNFEVGVHIADVSWYVTPGSPVDKEARERNTSVYLVDRTVPMLPEKLCNKLCSLRPEEDKLTFSALFEITPQAKVLKRWIGRSVINSNYRLNYDEAQEIIEGGEHKDSELKDAIITLNSLAQKFKKARFNAGAINFDRPEMKVEVDAEGKPLRVYQKVSKEANFLIEEFMLLANRTVAEWVATGGKSGGAKLKDSKAFVYRVHGEPNLEKLENLKAFAGNFGYRMDPEVKVSERLNALMSSAKGKPEYNAFENLALRSMAKAYYSTDNIGHYGLAFQYYTHFTSPIRRYPDLMVHRLLSSYLGGGKGQDKVYFEEQCKYSSERELVAADAERTSVKYKLVEYMQDKVGLEFDGSISGITEWGMYVEIEPTKIEGMISLREIRSDFFEFDQDHYLLKGKRTRRVFRLGDKVKIKVKNANLEQRLLDFELVEKEEEGKDLSGKEHLPRRGGRNKVQH